MAVNRCLISSRLNRWLRGYFSNWLQVEPDQKPAAKPGKISELFAKMEAAPTNAYNQDNATGFVRLNGLRLKVAAKVQKRE